jgi:hypothetical protein
MKENKDWRTIQIMLEKNLKNGAPEINEVSIHTDGPSNIRCTCQNYSSKGYCKHTIMVTTQIEQNNGSFGLMIPEEIPDEVAFSAFSSPEKSREFIIRYGKIVVM